MLSSFASVEIVATDFNPHRHDTLGLFPLGTAEMTLLVEGQEVTMYSYPYCSFSPGQMH